MPEVPQRVAADPGPPHPEVRAHADDPLLLPWIKRSPWEVLSHPGDGSSHVWEQKLQCRELFPFTSVLRFQHFISPHNIATKAHPADGPFPPAFHPH